MSNSDSMTEVFAAMGSALTRWSMVDRILTEIYAVAVNPRKPQMAAASIWKVTGHNLKVEMTETALEALFLEYPKADPEPVRISWKTAKKEMTKAVKGRNDLGHASLYSSKNSDSRVSVLEKDRDKFIARMQGDKLAPEFTASDCYDIETRVWTQLAQHLIANRCSIERKFLAVFSKRIASRLMSFILQKNRSTRFLCE